MTRLRRVVAVVAGTLAVLFALVAALLASGSGSGDAGGFVALVVLVGAVGALLKLRCSDARTAAAPPWSDEGALVADAPERTASDHPLSGEGLADAIEAAGSAARESGRVEDGLAEVRPALREALVDALVVGGWDGAAVERALADGTWTDDRAAAAVLDGGVVPPDRPLRRRVEAWLFPERAVVRRTGRAVQAVAEAADDALPAVVGQDAPRSVPVLPPTLDEQQRTADGSLRPARDPGAVDSGPAPTPSGGEPDDEGTDDRADADGPAEAAER